MTGLRQKVLRLAAESGCSAYDSHYAALAQELDVLLLTHDGEVLGAFPETAVHLNDVLTEGGCVGVAPFLNSEGGNCRARTARDSAGVSNVRRAGRTPVARLSRLLLIPKWIRCETLSTDRPGRLLPPEV